MESGRESERKGKSGEGKGTMTVSEAGHEGGQRVKELIEEGKQAEGQQGSRSGSSGSESSRSGSSRSGSSGAGSSSKGSSSGKKDSR